ncbi:hypothetical protein ALC53_02169 [Atta colombica]|uniref:Uncharacterized protein n=1 Tax=Atta colombica TaxID=520822 RepID=A0A195BS49_9HYME|nr:hypothetical protein ALC53_02169 [Atta colombica]
MNGPSCRSRDERTTAMIVNERTRAVEGLEGRNGNARFAKMVAGWRPRVNVVAAQVIRRLTD